MNIQKIIETVEQSNEYQQFKSEYSNAFLAHIFLTESSGNTQVEVGYYVPSKDQITSFQLNPFKQKPAEDIFKKSGTLQALTLDNITIDYAKVRKLIDKAHAEHYSAHPISKYITILQFLDEPVWNITLVTTTLHFINLRISAASGKILQEDLHNLMDLGTRMQGTKTPE